MLKIPIYANSSTLLFFGSLSLTLLNFLMVVVLSNNLPVQLYGELREVMLYASFIFILGSSGFSQALFYFLNKTVDQVEVLRITGALRVLLIIFSIIVIIGFFFFQLFHPFFSNIEETTVFVLYLLALILSSVDLNLFFYHKKGKSFFISNSIVLLIKLLLIFSATQLNYSLLAYLEILCITQWMIVIINLIILKRRYFGVFNDFSDRHFFKKIVKYSLPLTLSSLLGFLIINTDKILVIISNLTEEKLAILSNVSFEAPLISTVYLSFFTTALPSMIKAYDGQDFKKVIIERYNYIYVVAKFIFPVVISFIIWNQDYVALIFGDYYKSYGYLFGIFSIIGLLRFCSHHDVFLASNNTSYILNYQIIEFIVQVFLSIILYYYYDLLGLVIASVITNYGYMFFVNLKISKILRVGFIEVLPFAFLLKRLLALSLSAIAIKLIFEMLFDDLIWMVPLAFWLFTVGIVEIRILKAQNSK